MGQISFILLPEEVYVEPFYERRKLVCDILQGLGALPERVQ